MGEVSSKSELLKIFFSSSKSIYHSLEIYGYSIFGILATLSIAVLVIMHLVSGEEISNLWGKLLKEFVLVLVAFFFLKHATDIFFQFFKGALDLGIHAGQITRENASPFGFLANVLDKICAMINAASSRGIFSGIGTTLMVLFIAFFMLIMGGLIAAELAVIYGKFYIVIGLVPLIIPFGAWSYTRNIMVNYIKGMVGVLIQVATMIILIKIFNVMSETWKESVQAFVDGGLENIQPIIYILPQLAIFYMLVKSIPPFVAGMVGFGSYDNKGAQTVMMAGAAAGIATKTASAGMTGTIDSFKAGKKGYAGAKATTMAAKSGAETAAIAGMLASDKVKSGAQSIVNSLKGGSGEKGMEIGGELTPEKVNAGKSFAEKIKDLPPR